MGNGQWAMNDKKTNRKTHLLVRLLRPIVALYLMPFREDHPSHCLQGIYRHEQIPTSALFPEVPRPHQLVYL